MMMSLPKCFRVIIVALTAILLALVIGCQGAGEHGGPPEEGSDLAPSGVKSISRIGPGTDPIMVQVISNGKGSTGTATLAVLFRHHAASPAEPVSVTVLAGPTGWSASTYAVGPPVRPPSLPAASGCLFDERHIAITRSGAMAGREVVLVEVRVKIGGSDHRVEESLVFEP